MVEVEVQEEVGEHWEGQCRMGEVGDLSEDEEQLVLVPTVALRRPNVAPLVVQAEQLEGRSEVAVGQPIPAERIVREAVQAP